MRVLVFPYDQANPYQDLLYGAMSPQVESAYLEAPNHSPLTALIFLPRLLIGLVSYRRRGFKILHIHWLHTLSFNRRWPLHRQIGALYGYLFLGLAHLLGYRLVWTVHNVLPHRAVTSRDLALRRWMSQRAYKIIHSSSTVAALTARGILAEPYSVVPHGNYRPVYPDTVDPDEARRALGIPRDASVILFFGGLANYKNLPHLLGAFAQLRVDHPDYWLVIAGRGADPQLTGLIRAAEQASDGRLVWHNRYIANTEVPQFFAAAQVTAFPFTEITTSGSVLLALTFGLPVVAPRLGALQNLPAAVGVLYDPSKPEALRRSLETILEDPQRQRAMRRAAQAYGDGLSWDGIAAKTEAVYQQVLAPQPKDSGRES